MNAKQRAAEAAMAYVRDGMVVGLGTGSTSNYFHDALADALKGGRLRGIRGVPTSEGAARRARERNIPLATLAECPRPDVTVDGADEVGPGLVLIKGLGGALLREKIVAQNSGMMVVIADSGKVVSKLGTKSPLPVEVTKFGHETHEAYFRTIGATATLRQRDNGGPFETDNGNYIYDCWFPGGIDDPAALDALLRRRAGVVETGLFIGIASVALIADDSRVEVRNRS